MQTVAGQVAMAFDLLVGIGNVVRINGQANLDNFPAVFPPPAILFQLDDAILFRKLRGKVAYLAGSPIVSKIAHQSTLAVDDFSFHDEPFEQNLDA
jgi:hypothetical protein